MCKLSDNYYRWVFCFIADFLFWQASGGEDDIQQLQKALLDYLDENTETDASLVVNFSFLILSIYKNNLNNISTE